MCLVECQVWRAGQDDLIGGGWTLRGGTRWPAAPGQSSIWGQVVGTRFRVRCWGVWGAPHPVIWHTPGGLLPPAPGVGAAGGAHLSPTGPAGGAGLALGRWQSYRHSSVENHFITRPLPGNKNRKSLGDTGPEGCHQVSGSVEGTEAPLNLEAGGSVTHGQCSDWVRVSRRSVLGNVDCGLLGPWKVIAASSQPLGSL